MINEESLNIVQQVFRGVIIATGATNPEKLNSMINALMACAASPGTDETARQMLADLAAGLEIFAQADIRPN